MKAKINNKNFYISFTLSTLMFFVIAIVVLRTKGYLAYNMDTGDAGPENDAAILFSLMGYITIYAVYFLDKVKPTQKFLVSPDSYYFPYLLTAYNALLLFEVIFMLLVSK